MNKVLLYTDGACSGNPGPGGYAAILVCGAYEKEIKGGEAETTNNRMELLAVIEGLKCLKEKCEVTVYSDSSYVINSFTKGWIYAWQKAGWKRKDGELKNVDLIKELYALSFRHQITWVWVKGHADNEYNNRCDKMAVEMSAKYAKQQSEPQPENQPEIQSEPKLSVRDTVYEGELFEKTTGCVNYFDGRVFKVDVLDVELPDKTVSTREIVRHTGGAAVVSIDDEKNVSMVRQYRIATGKVMLEIPAGKLEACENPMDCAARELTEETGMKAGKVTKLCSYYATPGYCTEKLQIYLATDLTKLNPHRDEGEFLHIIKMPLNEVVDMIGRGEIEDGKTINGILMAKTFYL